jgi:uncharacterized protein YbjT (DUF2867 family)
MPENFPTTLVTGATGEIGSTLTRLLTEAGAPFRVMARRPEQIDRLAARGVDAVRGDFTDPASIRAALSGCEQLFLLPPATPDMYAQTRQAIDAARETGVRHILKVSASDANPHSSVPWAADHARSDAYLRQSGVAWTLLRPTCFMSNLLPMAPVIRRGLLPGTSGHGATSWVAGADIAAAALRVLQDPTTQGTAHDGGRSHLLSGTQAMSFPDVADVLTDELGRRVRYLHLPGPLMYLGLRAGGSSHWQARGLVHQFADVVRHGRDGVREHSPELADLIGRPPTDLASFVRDHLDTLA